MSGGRVNERPGVVHPRQVSCGGLRWGGGMVTEATSSDLPQPLHQSACDGGLRTRLASGAEGSGGAQPGAWRVGLPLGPCVAGSEGGAGAEAAPVWGAGSGTRWAGTGSGA